MKKSLCLLSMAVFCSFSVPASGQDTAAERLNILEHSLKSQSILIEEQQRAIGALKEQIEKQKETQAGQPGEDGKLSARVGGFFGGSVLTNPNISLSVDAFVYGSTLDDDSSRTEAYRASPRWARTRATASTWGPPKMAPSFSSLPR
jgi:hypothetical protein